MHIAQRLEIYYPLKAADIVLYALIITVALRECCAHPGNANKGKQYACKSCSDAEQIKISAWCLLQVLNVAEKNSIAVQVSSALSNNSARREASWFAWPRACSYAVLKLSNFALPAKHHQKTSQTAPLYAGENIRLKYLLTICTCAAPTTTRFFRFQYNINGTPLRHGVHLGGGAPAGAGL